MKVTPDFVQGEFIGLNAKVAKSSNSDVVRMSGKVVDETRNTFAILHDGKEKIIIKETSVFHFTLDDGTEVEVDGKLLVGRPEDRVKKRIRRLW
jgi:ribonuclease P protein subunit POP4